jgi:hypothetical protein
VIHDNPADNHYQNPRQNDQAGENKKFEIGNMIPAFKIERFVQVDKYQCKKSSGQNQINNILFII